MTSPLSPLDQHVAHVAVQSGRIEGHDLARAIELASRWKREGREADLADAIGEIARLRTADVEELRAKAKRSALLVEAASSAPSPPALLPDSQGPLPAPRASRLVRIGFPLSILLALAGWLALSLQALSGPQEDPVESLEPGPAGEDVHPAAPSTETPLDPPLSGANPPDQESREQAALRLARRIASLSSQIESLKRELARIDPHHPLLATGTATPPENPALHYPPALFQEGASPAADPPTALPEPAWRDEMARAADMVAAGDELDGVHLMERTLFRAPRGLREEGERLLMETLAALEGR